MLHQIKAQQFHTDLARSLSTVLNPTENSKIQGLFKAIECFSSTFQGTFNFQGLYKKALYIQALFKPVQTLSPSSISASISLLSPVSEKMY